MIRRLMLAAMASGVVFGMAGCRNNKCCQNGDLSRPPQPFLPSGPGAPPVIGPPSGGTTIPPAGVPASPPPSVLPPGGTSNRGSLPPPDPLFGAPREGNYRPPPAPNTGKPPTELLLPETLPNGASSTRSQYPANDPTRGVLGAPQKPATKQTAEPPLSRPQATAGLPSFLQIKPGVSTGRKPAIDGFDSLKQTGCKTVVYLHGHDADVTKDRDVARSRGLTFVDVETTPETLPDALKRVNAVASERSAKPVYVYDEDGLRAGAVWYLYFRTVDLQSADVAGIRARGIGLTDQTDEGRAFWVAIQQYLASR